MRFQNVWLALGLIAMGIAIEFAQELSGYHHFELFDVVAVGVGVLSGWAPSVTPFGKGLW